MAIYINKVILNGVQWKFTLPKEFASSMNVDVEPYFAFEK